MIKLFRKLLDELSWKKRVAKNTDKNKEVKEENKENENNKEK